MKTIKTHFNSIITTLCSALLSILGFSCSSSPEDAPDMYGMPIGDFEIKGAVTDEDEQPVEDAEIRVTASHLLSGVESLKTAFTDKSGKYYIHEKEYPLSPVKVVCIPSSPALQPDSVIVKLNYTSDGKDFWDVGHAEETVNFTLKSAEE